MRIVFAGSAWEDYLHWQATDKRVMHWIHELITDASRHPFEGLGKPEPLRHALAGYWSRRITAEQRMVYKAVAADLSIAQLRFHYHD